MLKHTFTMCSFRDNETYETLVLVAWFYHTDIHSLELSPPLPPHADFSLPNQEEKNRREPSISIPERVRAPGEPSISSVQISAGRAYIHIYSIYLKSYSYVVATSKTNPWDSLYLYINELILSRLQRRSGVFMMADQIGSGRPTPKVPYPRLIYIYTLYT